ncbi:hypothetical protein [Cardinium endosymbiont of Culicoides punctatus]|uniref:hypothetical protein n=1 Tax=Cardinium endosymbiont of Culicoides punctatus TaxID=2304601 RepID=UPI001058AE50|nr:hypothetical protein [Cardinium endosymbiont of Culicoides punctatus]TDG95552.1 hypothetical protein CCPUN_02880 [Cardinium endosymbiont of Culicoides punctatus]
MFTYQVFQVVCFIALSYLLFPSCVSHINRQYMYNPTTSSAQKETEKSSRFSFPKEINWASLKLHSRVPTLSGSKYGMIWGNTRTISFDSNGKRTISHNLTGLNFYTIKEIEVKLKTGIMYIHPSKNNYATVKYQNVNNSSVHMDNPEGRFTIGTSNDHFNYQIERLPNMPITINAQEKLFLRIENNSTEKISATAKEIDIRAYYNNMPMEFRAERIDAKIKAKGDLKLHYNSGIAIVEYKDIPQSCVHIDVTTTSRGTLKIRLPKDAKIYMDIEDPNLSLEFKSVFKNSTLQECDFHITCKVQPGSSNTTNPPSEKGEISIKRYRPSSKQN